ncbi:MAG: tetratricopeptide repeat protein [Ruminococcaceae bacterium]|nr:tetratricopeptide repeat protein [Oscillospiraceae bacterium]
MKKGLKIFVIVAMILLAAAVVALLVWEYIEKGEIKQETALKAAAIGASLIIATIRLISRDRGAVALEYKKYEELYADYIKNAFVRPEQKKHRKELLKAIGYYNRDEFQKALGILEKLKGACQKYSDSFAVNMFKALCYSDMGIHVRAIESYKSILAISEESSTVWSNLGLLYVKEGKNREAEECYKKAIEKKPESPFPYNNLGTMYLKESRYDEAIKYALEALERKNNMYQASNTLAIAYTLTGEFDLADKYFKISVANGVDAEGLREAINSYCEELD